MKEGWKDESSEGRLRKDEEPNSGTKLNCCRIWLDVFFKKKRLGGELKSMKKDKDRREL